MYNDPLIKIKRTIKPNFVLTFKPLTETHIKGHFEAKSGFWNCFQFACEKNTNSEWVRRELGVLRRRLERKN